MTAARTAAATPAATDAETKTGPKHAAPKAHRFNLSPRTTVQNAKVAVTGSPLTSEGRSARRLRKAVEAQNIAPKATKTVPLTVVQPTFTFRKGVEVDSKGEATPIYRTVAAGFAKTTETVGETLAETFDTSPLARLFETADQRDRRINVTSVANTLLLLAGVASKIASHKGK